MGAITEYYRLNISYRMQILFDVCSWRSHGIQALDNASRAVIVANIYSALTLQSSSSHFSLIYLSNKP